VLQVAFHCYSEMTVVQRIFIVIYNLLIHLLLSIRLCACIVV